MVLMSGFAESGFHAGGLDRTTPLLAKPFSRDKLLAALRRSRLRIKPPCLPTRSPELIYVVEDEAAIARLIADTLEKFGYRPSCSAPPSLLPRPAPPRPTWSSSTWACPTWTAWRCSSRCAASTPAACWSSPAAATPTTG
jgi:hypothetical protein